MTSLIRRAALCGLFALVAAAGLFAQSEERKPTFEKSRPAGPKQVLKPLPTERPIVPEIRFGQFRPFNPIDNFILKTIQERKARPKGLCDDWDFARRASLDLVGVTPTVADLQRYSAWKAEERRVKWVDHLLAQPHYADHWTTFWGDLLRERGQIRGVPANSLKRYIHENLAKNRPYDAWVREMLTADGKAAEKPATAFVLRDDADPKTLTVTVTQTFLGIQLKCAECHDHPFDWWTERDFNDMAAFWHGTQGRAYDREEMLRGGRRVPTYQMEVVSNERRANGRFITGVASDKGKGRAGLADLVTRPDNPYFARVVVNRLWEKMMGLGLVNPVDNFTPRNPPSHPELLDWLAMEFIQHKYDLKHVLRLIATSRTYQQTSAEKITRTQTVKVAVAEGEEESIAPGSLFDGMLLRRMTAEQLNDSILVATGHYLEEGRRYSPSIEVTYPPDARSFLRTFGCPDRETLLPRNTSGSIQQALTLLNGDLVNMAIQLHVEHPIRYWQKELRWSTDQVLDALFVQILTRYPTKYERGIAMQYLRGGYLDWAWEDLQWALINCREFQYIR
jgi:hypothetical protein